jgi:UPF0042 nucleotide-binding protein
MMAEPVELALITGLSGAGRGTVARAMEDLGWFVVDNLPPALLETMAELALRGGGGVGRVAVVIDVRSRPLSADDLRAELAVLHAKGVRPRVVFLEASDEVLVRRFDSVRRPHPLQGEGRLVDGIAKEREILRDLRGDADLVLDTSELNVHELRSAVEAAFAGKDTDTLRATVVSFGYKYGLPVDADLVADCRFLPNPHWVEDLRPLTGRDEPVRRYVLSQPGAGEFLDHYQEVLAVVREGYAREGKRFLTLAVGCTGGKHRSVVISEEIARGLIGQGVEARVVHRDLGRE